jgi:hypothetical protein
MGRQLRTDSRSRRADVSVGATLRTCERGRWHYAPEIERKTCLRTRARQPRSVSLAHHPCHPDCGSGLSKAPMPSKVGTRPLAPLAVAAIPNSYFSLGAVGAPYVPHV